MVLMIIGGVLLVVMGFGLFRASQLRTIQITKSVIVNGSRQEVFDMVRYLRNFPQWSPFLAADPTQKYQIKGNDGHVGALYHWEGNKGKDLGYQEMYHWEGNKGKDLGYQEIVEIEALDFIGMKCDIQKPFKAAPTFEYSFSEAGVGIKVTQDFKLESGLVDAFFMWVFGAKKEMEATNEKGLKLLKAAVEG